MASKSDPNNQRDLIATYDNLSKHQRDAATMMLAEAARPVYGTQLMGC
jgi:hypothetical protein